MKVKRLLAALLTLCMLIPVLPTITVSAVNDNIEWQYYVKVYRSGVKDSRSKKNAIEVQFFFGSETSSTYKLSNVDNKNNSNCETTWVTDGHSPWLLDKVRISNTSKNGFAMYYIEVKSRARDKKTGEVKFYKQLASIYPDGEGNNKGYWIDQNDNHPKYYDVKCYGTRSIKAAKGFNNLNLNEFFSLDGSYKDENITKEWNGSVDDQYATADYNAWKSSGVPKITHYILAYTGEKNTLKTDTFNDTNFNTIGLKTTEKGYVYNKKKLFNYMNNNNINEISMGVTVNIPKKADMNDTYQEKAYVHFTRGAFEFNTPTFNSVDKYASADNFYYNDSHEDRTITTKIPIKMDVINYDHLKDGRFNNKEFKYDSMYLSYKDGEGKEKTIPATDAEKSIKISNGCICPEFKYDTGLSSSSGFKLIIKDGKIKVGSNEYYLNAAKKNNVREYTIDCLKYRVDSKKPSITISEADGTDFDRWNKQVKINIKGSEEIYGIETGGGRKQAQVKLYLVDKGSTSKEIFKYGLAGNDATINTTEETNLLVPIETSGSELAISTPDKIEGEYQLVLEGEDVAGNKLTTTVMSNVLKLDNKPPEVDVKRALTTIPLDENGSKSEEFKVTIGDLSGTGRLYYMFTEKSEDEVKKSIPSALDGIQGVSGEIIAEENTWKYITQKDSTSSIVLKVPKGKRFNGRVVFFGIDDAGNKSDVASTPIDISNDDMTFSATPDNVDGYKPSFNIHVDTSEKNKVLYRLVKADAKYNDSEYTKYPLGKSFELWTGDFDTAQNPHTKDLNGRYNLEFEIYGQYGSKTTKTYTYLFDNTPPVINVSQPTRFNFKGEDKISINIKDNAGVALNGATAKIVNVDGSDIEGNSDIPLTVSNGSVSDTVMASGLESGVYAVKITAADVNGLKSETLSAPFFIRRETPSGTVEAVGAIDDQGNPMMYNGKPLVSEGMIYYQNGLIQNGVKLKFNLKDAFANMKEYKNTSDYAANTPNVGPGVVSHSPFDQKLYYRISTTPDGFGDTWRPVGSGTDILDMDDEGYYLNDYVEYLTFTGFVSGFNTLYVQTAIVPYGTDQSTISSAISSSSIRTDAVEFFYDDTEPTGELVLPNTHTTETVKGYLYVEDNVALPMTAKSDNSSIVIGEYKAYTPEDDLKGGVFEVSVTENVENAKITLTDAGGNKTDIPVNVSCIDLEPPTVDFESSENIFGSKKEDNVRVDAIATVNVYDMAEAVENIENKADASDDDSDEENLEKLSTSAVRKPMFALIPVSDYSSNDYKDADGKIKDAYFKENLQKTNSDIYFEVTETKSENATEEDEFNKTYSIKVAGVTGEYYLAVRAEDSLGNGMEKIFLKKNIVEYNRETGTETEETVSASLNPVYPELSLTATANPDKVDKYSVAKIEFNRPVYVLPQDKIVDTVDATETDDEDKKTVDDVNLELAAENSFSYSKTTSFKITENKTYNIYTADDLGRTEKLTADISGITFNYADNISLDYKIYKGASSKNGGSEVKKNRETNEYEMISVRGEGGPFYLEITATAADEDVVGDKEMLLLPERQPGAAHWMDIYLHGLEFDSALSADYAVDAELNPIPTDSGDDRNYDASKKIFGYTKLVYKIDTICQSSDTKTYPDLTETTERLLPLRAFDKGNTSVGTEPNKTLVIPNIDNTDPKVEMTLDPANVMVSNNGAEIYNMDGTGRWKYNPTPGNVTFTLTAQDLESGIDDVGVVKKDNIETGNTETGNTETSNKKSDVIETGVMALSWYDYGKNDWVYLYAKPDEDGYWKWDGSLEENGNKLIGYEYDETGNEVPIYGNLPLVIEYIGDPNNPYGVKTLKYTYSEAINLHVLGYDAGLFTNRCGASSSFKEFGSVLSTENMIYKMPIEKDKDYRIVYTLKDGTKVSQEEIDTNYYNNVKASIEIIGQSQEDKDNANTRGFDRGLYVSNNNKNSSVNLNAYQRTFTFNLKDKYGYNTTETVELKNVDVTPGTIAYTLDTTEKTNQPYNVTITATDTGSGVSGVSMKLENKEIELTDTTPNVISPKIYTGTIAENGNYSIVMHDKAGNRAADNFNIGNISTTAPTATVTYSGGGKEWKTPEEAENFFTSQPVTATLSFSDTSVKIAEVDTAGEFNDYSVDYGTNVITFTKSGSVIVKYQDSYGNVNTVDVNVDVIDKTPPKASAEVTYDSAKSSAEVSFNKMADTNSQMDVNRKETEMYISYKGVTQPIANADGSKNVFSFSENGTYSFMIYEESGLSSVTTIKIEEIDKKSPKITEVSWSYEYDEYNSETKAWDKKKVEETINPTAGTIGYRISTDKYHVTNQDVTVNIKTDTPTRLVGSDGEFSENQERVYGENGYFDFNLQKENNMVSTYGVDVQVIDKTPPTIDLGDKEEMVFYENPNMNAEPYNKDMLVYSAYDVFFGEKTDLTADVQIDWGGFDPDNISNNKFDSGKPYTITYTVYDHAGNETKAQRKIRLVGKYDTIATVNGMIPSYSGKTIVSGDTISVALKNFSGTAYVKYEKGIYTMGQMKTIGTIVPKNANGEFEVSGLDRDWYTFYVQTDKRDYFTICVYAGN